MRHHHQPLTGDYPRLPDVVGHMSDHRAGIQGQFDIDTVIDRDRMHPGGVFGLAGGIAHADVLGSVGVCPTWPRTNTLAPRATTTWHRSWSSFCSG